MQWLLAAMLLEMPSLQTSNFLKLLNHINKWDLRINLWSSCQKMLENLDSTVKKSVFSFGMNAMGGRVEQEFEKLLFMHWFHFIQMQRTSFANKLHWRLIVVLEYVSAGGGMVATLGFVLYPGVPRTTSVTQEINQNYGPFKQTFSGILELVMQLRLHNMFACLLQPLLVGLLVFCGWGPLNQNVTFVWKWVHSEMGRKISCNWMYRRKLEQCQHLKISTVVHNLLGVRRCWQQSE